MWTYVVTVTDESSCVAGFRYGHGYIILVVVVAMGKKL